MKNLTSLPIVLMKNTATVPIRIPSDFIAEWAHDGEARPVKVVIAPGATVGIRPEYCARSRAAWSKDRDRDPDADSPVMAIAAPISLAAPQLEPADDDSRAFCAEVWHDSLPSVVRAMEELKRVGAAERGEIKRGAALPRTY